MTIPVLGGLIGRLFGHQEVAQAYKTRRSMVAGAEEAPAAQGGDLVSLSEKAPSPLPARMLEEAQEVSAKLSQGEPLTGSQEARLREDRVFAAVVALSLVGVDRVGKDFAWPAGFPIPTSEELAAAAETMQAQAQKLEAYVDELATLMGETNPHINKRLTAGRHKMLPTAG